MRQRRIGAREGSGIRGISQGQAKTGAHKSELQLGISGLYQGKREVQLTKRRQNVQPRPTMLGMATWPTRITTALRAGQNLSLVNASTIPTSEDHVEHRSDSQQNQD